MADLSNQPETEGVDACPPQAEEAATWNVFICYRQVDGNRLAEWAHDRLEGRRLDFIPDGCSEPPRLSVYFDQTAPAVDDWTQVHQPALERSRALLFVASPGAQHTQGNADWVHRELEWWIGNRTAAPILLDPTGEGDRWLPDAIRRRWPNAQRLPVKLEEWQQLEPDERERLEQRTVRRILSGIQASESSARREDLERERARRRKVERQAAILRRQRILLLAFLAVAILASLAFQRAARQARSRELAARAERSLDGGDYLKGRLLATEAARAAGTREAGYALRRSLGFPRLRMIVPATEALAPVSVDTNGSELLQLGGGRVWIWEIGTGRQLAQLETDQPLKGAVLEPAGETVATIDESGTVRLWSVESGAEPRVLTTGASAVWFSPDGSRLLTRGATWQLWDVDSGEPLAALGLAVDASFSKDGTRLALAGEDRKIRIFDAASGQALVAIEPDGQADPRSEIQIRSSPDGKTVLVWDTADRGSSVHLFDTDTGEPILVDENVDLEGEPTFSADSQFIAFVDLGWTRDENPQVRIWRSRKGRRTSQPRLVEVNRNSRHAGFDHLGRLWTFDDVAGDLTIWDWSSSSGTPERIRQINVRSDLAPGALDQFEFRLRLRTDALDFISWKTRPAQRSGEWVKEIEEMLLWELSTGEELARYDDPDSPVVYASFSADGRRILTRSEAGTARFWSAGADLLKSGPSPGAVSGSIVRELPEGARAFASDDGSSVLIVRPGTAPTLVEHLGAKESIVNLNAWEGDVQRAWLCNTGRRLVIASANGTSLWDPHENRELTALGDREVSVTDARFDPACLRLVIFDGDRVGRLWDAQDGSLLAEFGSERGVDEASFSSDGTLLATASISDSYLRIRDTRTGQELRQLIDLSTGTSWRHASFDADGGRVVGAGREGVAVVWDVDSGETIRRLSGHNGSVRYVAFSADDRWIVTAGSDRTARIWDASSGEEVAVLRHERLVLQAVFNPDGRNVMTVAGDSAFVFATAIEDLLGLAESHLPVNLTAEQRREFMER